MQAVIRFRSAAFGLCAATGVFTTNNIARQEDFYSAEDVRLQDGLNGKPMWVTVNGSVHDMTKFRAEHPGGNFIDRAAGCDVGEFWNVWRKHYRSPKVAAALEATRIGTLIDSAGVPIASAAPSNDPFSQEPLRNRDIHRVHSEHPFSTETHPLYLNKEYLTPAEALYVRNHGPVPSHLCAEDHMLVLSDPGDGQNTLPPTEHAISVAEMLRKFPTVTVTSVLQCAGNRTKEDIAATGPDGNGFAGTPHEDIRSGMAGNARWTGVRLADVIEHYFPAQCRQQRQLGFCAQDDQQDPEHLLALDRWHVRFIGVDEYESSTPLAHVLKARSECLLVTKMNGGELSGDHGYPLRIILPGLAGARSVKWLEEIVLSREPSTGPWNTYYYRRANGSQIQGLPMQSLILSPGVEEAVTLAPVLGDCDQVRVVGGTVDVQGVSYSGFSGLNIRTVQVSVDKGETWTDAVLNTGELQEDDSSAFYGWIRFSAKVPVQVSVGKSGIPDNISIWCRAVDSSGEVQPEVSPKQRGYLYNGWNKVDVPVNISRQQE